MDAWNELGAGSSAGWLAARLDQVDGRDAIAARVGVTGDFIRVPQLAKAIGISATSIHSQMRSGTFPLPHRRVGNVIVVKLDDYIEWFRSDGSGAGATRRSVGDGDLPAGKGSPERDPAEAADSCAAPPPPQETAAEFKARLKLKVRAGMRRKGFDV